VPALVDGPRHYRPTLPGRSQVVGISRNRWSLSPGLGGRFHPESVVALNRTTQTRTSGWFDHFVGAIAEGQEAIDPNDAGQYRGLAFLVSRPIAVARAHLDIELSGLPPRSASWEAFERALTVDHPDDASLDDSEIGRVAVSVRLGTPPPAVNRPGPPRRRPARLLDRRR
jgi:hypothetical protein